MIDTALDTLRSLFAWPWLLSALPLPWLMRRLWPAARSVAPALRVPYGERLDAIGGRSARARVRRGWACCRGWRGRCCASPRRGRSNSATSSSRRRPAAI